MDCADNFALTYLLQEFCIDNKLAFVSGSVQQFEARLFTYNDPELSCFGCAFPEVSPDAVGACNDFGVLSTTTSILGAMQAAEAVKAITQPQPAQAELTVINTHDYETHKFVVERRNDCVICGDGTARVERMDIQQMTPAELKAKLDAKKELVVCLLYTSPSPRDRTRSRMPSSA